MAAEPTPGGTRRAPAELAPSGPGPAGEADGIACIQAFGLLQLGDSLFPTGAFAYSHGLESFAQDGLVDGGDSLGELLADLLDQLAWTDGIALLHAYDATAGGDAAALAAADSAVLCRKLAREARDMSLRLGGNLWRAARTLWPEALGAADGMVRHGALAPTHPVAMGCAARAAGLGREAAFALGTYTAAAGVCGAALRLVRTDHLRVQGLLHQASPACAALYRECRDRGLRDMAGSAPALEIEAMRHQRAHVRLFAG